MPLIDPRELVLFWRRAHRSSSMATTAEEPHSTPVIERVHALNSQEDATVDEESVSDRLNECALDAVGDLRQEVRRLQQVHESVRDATHDCP